MWYNYQGGYDSTISNFQTATDVLYLPNGAANAVRYGNTLYVYGNNGGVLTVNADFNYTDSFFYSYDGYNTVKAAIVNSADSYNRLLYYDDTPVYIGNGSTNLFIFSASNKNIRLDSGLYPGIKDVRATYADSAGTIYESGYNFLFGNSQDNTLIDGNGSTVLFGGSGGNDALIGGAGTDYFMFGKGCGVDVILDAANEDTIYLYDVNPGEFGFGYDSTNDSMSLTLNDGSILVVLSLTNNFTTFSYAAPDFLFADGSRSWYSKYTGTWNSVSYDATEDVASNPLWGDANTFYGTDAADNIFLSKVDGNDLVFDAAQGDTIHFCDALLSDVIATAVSDNAVAIAFNTGETAVVAAEDNVSATFKLASGESYVYNRETSSWQQS